MGGEDKSVKPKKMNQLLHHDSKELEKVSNYAGKEKEEVDKLSADVTNMNFLQLWWDSKVPVKNKKIYNFVSGLTASDPEQVRTEIEKYQHFYKELIDILLKIGTEGEQDDWYQKIVDLSEDLSEMLKNAKLGKKATGSSTVYGVHDSFIEKHEKLENMIKRVECVTLKASLRNANANWEVSAKKMDNLEKELKQSNEKYDDMCQKFRNLELANKELSDQMKVLVQVNKNMQQDLNRFLNNNTPDGSSQE